MSIPTGQSCGSCRFWDEDKTANPPISIDLSALAKRRGRCLESPPTVCAIGGPQQDALGRVQIVPKIIGAVPSTAASEWCGRWQADLQLS